MGGGDDQNAQLVSDFQTFTPPTFGDGTDAAGIWDADTNTFTPVPGLTNVDRRDMGASVLLPPAQDQKVMVMGGGQHNDPAALATASTAIIDLTQASPAYVPGPTSPWAPRRRPSHGEHRQRFNRTGPSNGSNSFGPRRPRIATFPISGS